jgi:ribonucleoside-diphosphate reductase alpha chain
MARTKQTEGAGQEVASVEEVVNTVVDETVSIAPRRFFTTPGRDPFDEIEWELRDAYIPGKDGPAFEQRDVEFPKFWSQTATNIVAQKYFRGRMASPERERSVKQMIGRVVSTIASWGREGGYFLSEEETETFEAELKAILVNQYASFNSPVWFNVGFEARPQCSACQPWHALVSTPEGMVPIGQLVEEEQIGREVYDASGITRIVAVKANGLKEVFRITLRNGNFVEATGDHLVKAVPARRSRPAWLRVDELRPGMRMHLYPHRAKVAERARVAVGAGALDDGCPRSDGTDPVAVAEAALAGWLQADGFVGQYEHGTNRSLTIEFQVANDDERDWVLANLDLVFPGVDRHVCDLKTQDSSLRSRRIRLCGEELRSFVDRWQPLPRGTATRVPERLWTASREEISAYLRSVFQAHGDISIRDDNGTQSARIGFAVIGERWAEEIQLLLNVLGIYSRRGRKRETREYGHDLHEVAISIGSERARFAELVGFIGRDKQAKLLESLGLRGPESCPDLREEEIVSIESMGVHDVYDIQTESGEYLTNNVAVHNCFILSIEDSMESILDWIRREGIIFRGGSGSGVNLSRLRSSKEQLSKGGYASGPVSFMRGADASAGTIKSGGKCFREGTLVATPEGWKPIEQLRVGEHVLTHKGPRAVVDFMPNGRRQCYRVLTREGYEVEVTEGHKFAYWNTTRGGFDVKPIEEFRPGDALYALLEPSAGGVTIPVLAPAVADPAHPTTTVEMELPTELDERLAYIVGLTYGDGELRTTYPYRLRVAFCKDEAGSISADRFREYSRELFGEEPSLLGDEEGHVQLGFTRKRLVEFLVANGLAKGKRDELGFPSMLFRATPEVRSAFLAGVIDANGAYQQRGGWSINSIDRVFLRDLQRLLLSLGIPSKIKPSRDARGTWRPLYRLSVVDHTFVERLTRLIAPHSAKALVAYEPSAGADKGWGYRPSVYGPLAARAERRGGYRFVERTAGMKETSGYRAVATLAAHPDSGVAEYAEEISTCVQLTLESVTPTEAAQTYDIEVEDVHLLSANGLYASNTRRAAKMVVLDVDHPDIEEFIWCKAREERKARVLEAAGYDMSLDSPDWASIQYQNANNSVRVTDAFMEAVLEGKEWNLVARTDGSVIETKNARDLLRQIAEAAWECADPGIQYDTTINAWHTCPNSGRINASNPCSEYMHIDDSACNLASLNLLKFRREDGELDIEAFEHVVDTVFLAQEIIVGYSSYPTPEIERNAKAYRQLGLGYANLGALLMARGLPYDSDEGRAYAAAITALMTGRAYRKSAEIARRMGPFAGYRKNAAAMTGVIAKHRAALGNIDHAHSVPDELLNAARRAWDEALELGEVSGWRNAQATVLAPTGTISFMMDCDTTGVEPDFSLVKSKKLVGGGEITIVNRTVPMALEKLGYTPSEIEEITAFIDERNSIVGAPYVKSEHYPVFDCAIGERAIHYMGHVKMMGAVQPFISGAISKTVNLPEEISVEEISQLFVEAWRLGVKAIAIYRDNCKVAQPLSKKSEATVTMAPGGGQVVVSPLPRRRRLPDDRVEIGRKFKVGEYEGYIHVGLFEDGTPGDIFVDIAKEGTTLAGLMNSFMIAVSLGLQYGVPLEVYVSKFSHMRFEPSGLTNDPDIRVAKSIVDYIFRWMGKKFLSPDQQEEAGILTPEVKARLAAAYAEAGEEAVSTVAAIADAPPPGQTALFNQWEDAIECSRCGGRMVRTGSCYTCRDCGTNTGCS